MWSYTDQLPKLLQPSGKTHTLSEIQLNIWQNFQNIWYYRYLMIMLCLKKNCYKSLTFSVSLQKRTNCWKNTEKRSIDETWEIKSFMFTAKYDLNYWNFFVKFWIYIICSKEVLIIELFIFFFIEHHYFHLT